MVKLDIQRRPTQGNYFVGYLLTVDMDGKQYDLNVSFLIWAQVKPNEETAFFLRPEADAGTYKEPRTPVEKKEIFDGTLEHRWKPGIKEVRHLINTVSFPLNPRDNHELFVYCFNDPVRFSETYNERLKELQAYSAEHGQEIWSAPKWSEVDSASLIPVDRVPKEADDFFLNVFKLRFEAAGHEVHS